MKIVGVLAAVAAAVIASPSTAAHHLDFIGTFSQGPYATLAGTVDYDLVGDNFSLLGSTITIGAAIIPAYGFDFYASPYGDLVIIYGGSAAGGYTLVADVDRGTGRFSNDGGDLGFAYTLSDSNHEIVATTVQFILPPATIPEPMTWAMMLVGFGAVGYALRQTRNPALARA